MNFDNVAATTGFVTNGIVKGRVSCFTDMTYNDGSLQKQENVFQLILP